MDVRIVSVPESKEDSETGLTLATWALAVVTLGGFVFAAQRQSRDMRESIAATTQAAEAARRSADLATQAAQQAAKDRRDALIRETTLAIHRVAFTATSVRDLAGKVPKATAELFGLANRRIDGDLPGTDTTRTRTVEAEAMLTNASRTLLTEWHKESEDQIAQTLLTSESHLEKLQVSKEEILRDLSQIETDKAAVRASMLAGRYKPGALP